MSWWIKILIACGSFLVTLGLALYTLSYKPVPEDIQYGMSFNTMYARELGLDWQETYDAIIEDLGVRHFRLAAHWPMSEPERGEFNFTELDYQIAKLEEVGGTAVLAVGRRLPRWPECHIPDWAVDLTWEEQKEELRVYIEAVVERYKDSPAVTYWQVENEPFLSLFAFEHCGPLDEDFLAEEVAMVKSLDGTRPVLVTDSGNLGTWMGAYKHGDAFGTSVYVHFWNPELGQFRTVLPPWFYRAKANVMALIYGKQETMLIELSAEPWLLEPITDVDIETQYSRMDLAKFDDILEYARSTRFPKQYLWGAEWWYWLKERGHEEMWTRGQELFKD
ncbi:MAG: beta-galactosidase [Candidatus Paceibacterota bacterium]